MKALKFLGVAVLACSMLFVSCKKDYTITVKADPEVGGTVSGGGSYAANATATLTATANAGYEFTGWSDGTTNNPRTITVTKSETYTAKFKEKAAASTTITFNNNSWTAAQVLAVDNSSQGYMTYQIMKTAGSTSDIFLIGYLQTAAGSYDYTTSDEDYMTYRDPSYYYTVPDQATADLLTELLEQTVEIGDQFWGWNGIPDSFTEIVTAVDLNAHWTTATFAEDVFDFANFVASGCTSYGETKVLNGNMNQGPWTLASAKADMTKKAPAKFQKIK